MNSLCSRSRDVFPRVNSFRLWRAALTLALLALVCEVAAADQPLWNGPPINGVTQYFPTAMQACKAWHDVYSPITPFYGTTPTSSWLAVYCSWPPHIGMSNPIAVNLNCIDANGNWSTNFKLVLPGICIPVNDPRSSRPSCTYNKGGNVNPTVHDPVMLATGALYERVTDYEDADRRLTIQRISRTRVGPQKVVRVPFGVGDLWRLNWEWELNIDPDSFVGSSYHDVDVVSPDGSSYGFTLQSSGTVTANGNGGVVDLSVQYVPGGTVNYQSILDNGGQFLITTTSGDQILMQLFKPSFSQKFVVGRPLQITYRGGYVWTFTYGSQGEVQSITDSLGRSIAITWYRSTLTGDVTSGVWPRAIQTITMPDGTTLNYTYDSYDADQAYSAGYARLRTFTRVLGGVTTDSATYIYDDPISSSLLTGVVNNAGVRANTWQYDSTGRVISVSGANGADAATIAYSFSADGYSYGYRTVTNALGRQTIYKFRLVSGIDPLLVSVVGNAMSNCAGSNTTITYDGNWRQNTRVDSRGNTTKYTYGSDGRILNVTEAFGTAQQRVSSYVWNTLGEATQIVRPGRTVAQTFDSLGRLITRQDTDTTTQSVPYSTQGQTRTWTYAYSTADLIASIDGPLAGSADSVQFGYSALGYLTSFTDPLGNVTSATSLNAAGLPLTFMDANGVTTTLVYDQANRPTSRTTSGETTSYEYWPTGLLKKVTLPDSSYVLYTYDDAARLTRISDGQGNRIDYTLDAMGNRTAENTYDSSNALHRTHARVYNALRQLYQDVPAAGTAAVTTTFGYDGNGNLTTVAAPMSRNSSYAYDALDRLNRITDPNAGVAQLTYDASDRVLTVLDPRNLSTSYIYDGFGRRIQVTSPDTGTTVSTYDARGNVATSTDARGVVRTYTYDLLDRVTSIASSTDPTITFAYDQGTNGRGHLTSASDANHSMTWAFDARGRVASRSQTVGSVTLGTSYTYVNGNLATVTTPSGQLVQFGYSNHQVASVAVNGTTILDQTLYEPLGAVSGWRWGNGTYAIRIFDTDGRPSTFDSGAGALSYSYDDAGRITGIADSADSSKSWTYGYNVLDRLNSGSRSGQTIGYTYDANGNRSTQSGSASATYTIASNSNRVNSITGALARTYSYDAAGNATGDGTTTRAFNGAGRLVTVTKAGVTTTYLYNALGQRVRKSNSGLTRYFAYDEAGHLIGEYDGAGALMQEVVWLGDVPVATLRPNGSGVSIYYVHSDHLNTPRRISRPSDNVIVWRWDSDPFGTDAPNEDPDGDSVVFSFALRFAGQYYDDESGTSYNYHRDYDPAVGRYVESDPIGLLGGINTYAYVKLNPIRFVDPFGWQEQTQTTTPTATPEPTFEEKQAKQVQDVLDKQQTEDPNVNPTGGDDSGAGKKGQAACDAETNRQKSEQEAADPDNSVPGQWKKSAAEHQAKRFTQRYYDNQSPGHSWNPDNDRGYTDSEHAAYVESQINGGTAPASNPAPAPAPQPAPSSSPPN